MKEKHQHCHFCGTAYDERVWPRRCTACGEMTWRNPIPVAVVVVPVDDGVLLVRRAIPPVGELALPGGFIDGGESWEVAAAREVREECGIEISGLRLARVLSPPDGAMMIVFGVAAPLTEADLGTCAPNTETQALVIVREPTELGFPLHTQVLADFFAGRLAPVAPE